MDEELIEKMPDEYMARFIIRWFDMYPDDTHVRSAEMLLKKIRTHDKRVLREKVNETVALGITDSGRELISRDRVLAIIDEL